APNTSYEIIIPAGKVRDYVGNPNPSPFRSTFSTGNSIRDCRIQAPEISSTGTPVSFSLSCTGFSPGMATWLYESGTLPETLSAETPSVHAYHLAGDYTVSAFIEGLPHTLTMIHRVI